MNHSRALHLYKAGARLARTSGSAPTRDKWIRDNRLFGAEAEIVRRGFHDEVALSRLFGRRTGCRLGRAS